jgi:hypothetical protein
VVFYDLKVRVDFIPLMNAVSAHVLDAERDNLHHTLRILKFGLFNLHGSIRRRQSCAADMPRTSPKLCRTNSSPSPVDIKHRQACFNPIPDKRRLVVRPAKVIDEIAVDIMRIDFGAVPNEATDEHVKALNVGRMETQRMCMKVPLE